MRQKDLADLVESIVGHCLLHLGDFEAVLAMRWLGLNIFKPEDFTELHAGAVVFSPVPSPASSLQQPEKCRQIAREKLHKFQEILGYTFNDPSFLLQAVTHCSYRVEMDKSYERLEFLGDAILDFLVTMTLAHNEINQPGQMTDSRSVLVNNCQFAKLALKYKYDLYIQQANSDLQIEIERVGFALLEDPQMVFLDRIEFDRVVKLLADIFESVAGAIYLDSGCSLDAVWSVYYPMMKDSIDCELSSPSKNIVARLYEKFTGPKRIVFEYTNIPQEDGTSYKNAICRISGIGKYEGKGLNKKLAKMRAAEEAMLATKDFAQADLDRLAQIYLEELKHDEKGTSLKNPRKRGPSNRGGPSPLSAHNGFFGCKHFSKANAFLKSQGLPEIGKISSRS